jgi:hypothetical protein
LTRRPLLLLLLLLRAACAGGLASCWLRLPCRPRVLAKDRGRYHASREAPAPCRYVPFASSAQVPAFASSAHGSASSPRRRSASGTDTRGLRLTSYIYRLTRGNPVTRLPRKGS